MATKQTIHNQILQDLVHVVKVLTEILETKELTAEDEERLGYGTKIVKNVKEKCQE